MLPVEQALGGQALLQLLEGQAQGADALGLHVLGVELVLACGLVHGHPAPDEHLHAVLGRNFSRRAAEANITAFSTDFSSLREKYRWPER